MAEAWKHHHTGHRQRLKAEFLAQGLEGWPDHKVLELLLCYAIPQGDVNGLAHELVERFGSLAGALDASVEELKRCRGWESTQRCCFGCSQPCWAAIRAPGRGWPQ